MPPIEIIYIGGKSIDVHSSQNTCRLTSHGFALIHLKIQKTAFSKITSFQKYKQIRFDEGRVPSQPIEKLQYILLNW